MKRAAFFAITVFAGVFLFFPTNLHAQNLKPIGSDLFKEFIPCKLYLKGYLVKEGYAKQPDMYDKFVKFKKDESSALTKIWNDETDEIVFTDTVQIMIYKRILSYSAFGNKNLNLEPSWLRLIKPGFMSLYYGFQPNFNTTPAYNMRYCMKATDTVAYFISMTYSGALTLTIGNEKGFRKNASYYFGDYEELVEKIKSSEYKFKDLSLIVDLYNTWYESK